MTMLVLSPAEPFRFDSDTSQSPLAPLLARQKALAGMGLLLLAFMLPTLAAHLADTRLLNGVGVWVKPLKFQASTGLYLLTLAWFWGYLPAARRTGRLDAFAWVVAAVALAEVAYITLQGGRGVASHFSDATVWEVTAFYLMGAGAVALTAASLALGLLIWRRGGAELAPAFRLAVILGLLLTFALGTATGAALGGNGAHAVGGAATDAGGLPIVGWSRSGGDLRVAHFFGLHALQILPAVGWFASRFAPVRTATAIVWGAALAGTALTLFALAEALAGRPFLPGLPGVL